MVEWNETFDVVVVGFGFTGAAAAVAAHDAGARVLLLEKMVHPGGISICSAGGVRIADDATAAFRYLKETNADTAPDDCLRALARGMTEVEGFIRQLASVNGAEVAVARVAANYPFEGGDTFGGFKPGERLLTSLAGCSAIDVVDILRKQRQEVTGVDIQVLGPSRLSRPGRGKRYIWRTWSADGA